MYMRVFYMYVYAPTMCVPSTHRGHETADPLAWPYRQSWECWELNPNPLQLLVAFHVVNRL